MMRNQWRQLLLLRCYCSSAQLKASHLHRIQVPSISYSFPQSVRSVDTPFYRSHSLRFFTSELAVEPPKDSTLQELAFEPPKDSPLQKEVTLLDIFSKTELDSEKIKLDLDANNVVLSHASVLEALRNLKYEPDVAKRLFNWVSEGENEKILSSKCCNLMLGILVDNGFIKEFWDLVEKMKKKGYGVLKATSLKALERFEKDGLVDDVKMLNELFVSGSTDDSVLNICSRVCRVIRRDSWSDDVEKQLREMNVEFSSELVSMVVENLGKEEDKGLMFFKWIEESGLFRHDEHTFNDMVKVLAMEASSENFWKVVEDMRKAGFEMEKDTYAMAMEQFVKKKMIHDAVDLWEFATGSVNKPSVQDFTFLLKKIVSAKELDMDLFSLVVRIYKEQGNVLTDSMFEAIRKSLISVNRLDEINKILKALEVDGGFIPSVAFHLNRREKSGEEMDNAEPSDSFPDHVTWSSLVYGFCLSGDIEKASSSLHDMVENVGVSNCHCALESVVNAYCRKKKAVDAFKLVSKMIQKNDVHPWHSTFKFLIKNLLAQREFKEALNVLPLMKAEGYPPPLDLFIEYLSKSGTPDDAMNFFEAMTVKAFPSVPVFLRLFEAYFKLGKNDFAQDLLGKCPRNVRNNADVLNLFFSMKSGTNAPVVEEASVA